MSDFVDLCGMREIQTIKEKSAVESKLQIWGVQVNLYQSANRPPAFCDLLAASNAHSSFGSVSSLGASVILDQTGGHDSSPHRQTTTKSK